MARLHSSSAGGSWGTATRASLVLSAPRACPLLRRPGEAGAQLRRDAGASPHCREPKEVPISVRVRGAQTHLLSGAERPAVSVGLPARSSTEPVPRSSKRRKEVRNDEHQE